MNSAAKFSKAIAALLGAVGTWGVTAVVEGGIDGAEWFGLLVAVAGVLGVVGAPKNQDADV